MLITSFSPTIITLGNLRNELLNFRCRTIENKEIKKTRILIIKPSALGDIVLTLPAFSALRKKFPHAHIKWLVRTEFSPLLDSVSGFNEKLLFDRKLLGKSYYQPAAFKALLDFIKKLRRGNFDIVIDFQGLLRTALFARLTGCKKRIGMKNSREFASIFYTHKISPPKDSNHLIDHFLKLASAAGAQIEYTGFNLFPCPDAVEQVAELLKKNDTQNKKYVVFIPGAAHNYKCWPADKFASLADKISKLFDLKILVAGTAKEKPLTEKIISLAQTQIIDFTGLTNIPQLIALLNNAALVITNDTGPGHIAAALNVPTVMIFGPTNPSRVGPYKKQNSVAAVEPDKRGSAIESDDPSHQVHLVTVETVLQKAAAHLQNQPLINNND